MDQEINQKFSEKENRFWRISTMTILMGLVAVLVSSCAESITLTETLTHEPVGFLHGLLHGILLPISFIVSLFDSDVAIYAIYNTGGWYDFGFLLGASASIGGSSKATG